MLDLFLDYHGRDLVVFDNQDLLHKDKLVLTIYPHRHYTSRNVRRVYARQTRRAGKDQSAG